MAEAYECGNEHSGSVKCGEFFEGLSTIDGSCVVSLLSE